jgi:hypothetical protein
MIEPAWCKNEINIGLSLWVGVANEDHDTGL